MVLRRVLLQSSILVILGMALSGCMVGPNFHAPEAPVVKSYTQNLLPSKTASTPSAGRSGIAQSFDVDGDIPAQWWTLFHSDALNQLIHAGIKNSPTLKAANETLQSAQDNYYSNVSALMVPSVSAGFSGIRQRSAGTPVVPSGVFNIYNASVNVSYTFDLWGANRRQLEALAAQVDNQRYQTKAAYLTLTSNIVTTAVTVASYQKQIEATKQLIDAAQKQLIIINKQYHLGGASSNQLLTQATQVAQLRATLPALEKNFVQSQDALAVLVGEMPGNAQLPNINLDDLVLPQKLPVSLPSQLVKQRPDVQSSEALLHAASAQVGVATAAMLPQISLGSTSLGSQANVPGSLFKDGHSYWSFGAGLLQPITQLPGLDFERKSAVESYNAALAQYQQTVLQAFQNVADTLQALKIDADNLQAQADAQAAAAASLKIAQQQYKLGGVSHLDLLNTQEKYQQIRINYIQAQALRYNDTAALFQALGGGWWNQPENKDQDKK